MINIPPDLASLLGNVQPNPGGGVNRFGPSTPPPIQQIANPQNYGRNSYMGQAMSLAGQHPNAARQAAQNPPPAPPPIAPTSPSGPPLDPNFPNITPTPGVRANTGDISSAFRTYLGRDPTPFELEYYSDRKRADQLYRDVIGPRLDGTKPYGTPDNPIPPGPRAYGPDGAPPNPYTAPAPSGGAVQTPWGPIDPWQFMTPPINGEPEAITPTFPGGSVKTPYGNIDLSGLSRLFS